MLYRLEGYIVKYDDSIEYDQVLYTNAISVAKAITNINYKHKGRFVGLVYEHEISIEKLLEKPVEKSTKGKRKTKQIDGQLDLFNPSR